MGKHTPWPWAKRCETYRTGHGYAHRTIVVGADGNDLGICLQGHRPQDDAIACLVLAAPDLLSALKALFDCGVIEHCKCPASGLALAHSNLINYARAAITKAEGKA